jgi:hypothetical protein
MNTPHIRNNVWIRRIHDSWGADAGWRTDIQASVLHNYSVLFARFVLDDGTAVRISMGDLRRALAAAPTRKGGTTVGPYNVDPIRSTVNGVRVDMVIEPPDRSTQAA